MALRKLSGLIFAALFSSALQAEAIQINPAHPDQYTVVEGDTLWGISGKFCSILGNGLSYGDITAKSRTPTLFIRATISVLPW